jgi:hypothetical protein
MFTYRVHPPHQQFLDPRKKEGQKGEGKEEEARKKGEKGRGGIFWGREPPPQL